MKKFTESIDKYLSRTKLYNSVYKVTKNITNHKYHDNGWQGVEDIKNAIKGISDDVEVSITTNGDYEVTPSQKQMNDYAIGHLKRYFIKITYHDIVLDGTLSCMACGTTQDPWKEYDMSLVVSKTWK